ncbi:MAG: hypothetical protein IT497_04695 [Ottowia sp.]|nr:hypothetical protein [Ottowia sp.]
MDKQDNQKIKAVGKALWRVVLPFSAMRNTVTLVKKEFQTSRQNLDTIKELGLDVKEKFSDTLKDQKLTRNDSFDDVMRRCSKNGLSEKALYRLFLRDKRVALGIGLLFAIFGMYGFLGGIAFGHGRSILLSIMSLIASQPLFFLVALRAQLRLWQLQTRRLSIEEKGGLEDFMREVPGWVWITLDPEFGKKQGERNDG